MSFKKKRRKLLVCLDKTQAGQEVNEKYLHKGKSAWRYLQSIPCLPESTVSGLTSGSLDVLVACGGQGQQELSKAWQLHTLSVYLGESVASGQRCFLKD